MGVIMSIDITVSSV